MRFRRACDILLILILLSSWVDTSAGKKLSKSESKKKSNNNYHKKSGNEQVKSSHLSKKKHGAKKYEDIEEDELEDPVDSLLEDPEEKQPSQEVVETSSDGEVVEEDEEEEDEKSQRARVVDSVMMPISANDTSIVVSESVGSTHASSDGYAQRVPQVFIPNNLQKSSDPLRPYYTAFGLSLIAICAVYLFVQLKSSYGHVADQAEAIEVLSQPGAIKAPLLKI